MNRRPLTVLLVTLTALATSATASMSADEVFDKAVKAMGGTKAISSIESMRTKLELEMMPGMLVQMDWGWAKSGGRFANTTSPQGSMELGTDGKLAWMKNPMGDGYSMLDDDMKSQLDEQAAFILNMINIKAHAKKNLTDVTASGTEMFEGRDCIAINYKDKKGNNGTLYYDAKTYLPAGVKFEESMNGQTAEQSAAFTDWKKDKDSGILVCRGISMKSPMTPMPMALKVTSVEFNKLKDKDFTAPDEVKALAGGK